MISNNELLKLFVRVPSNVEFNGATVSGAENEKRLFFEEATGKIWAKGIAYGGASGGGLTQEQVQTLINNTLALTDENNVIDKVSEVIAWFNNLPEGDAGAVALINLVGHPSSPAVEAVLYADETEYNTAKGTSLTAEEFAQLSTAEKTKTPAVEAIQASGLYALVEQNTAAISQNASDIDAIETEIGEKAVKYTQAEIEAAQEGDDAYDKTTDDIKTPSTGIYKYVDDAIKDANTSLNDLNTRVEALEEFDPWEDYVSQVQP